MSRPGADASADFAAVVARNLEATKRRIAAAARRGGRDPESVSLVAVTKYAPLEAVRALVDLGVRDLGESRPQALWNRAAELDPTIRWHLIGRLQTNKVRRTLPLVALVHSVDTVKLAQATSEEAVRAGRPAPILFEVNVTGEEQKQGFAPGELRAMMPRLVELPNLEIRGLMTMAAYADDPEASRPVFRALRELRDELRGGSSDPGFLGTLSMGMSGDFEPAIEEGATLVRVGSALFEGIE